MTHSTTKVTDPGRTESRQQKSANPALAGLAIVHGFVGGKGGVGTTSAALDYALSLWKQGGQVIAVEMRSCFGSFFHHTRTSGKDLMPLLVADAATLTLEQVQACLVNWHPKLSLLCAPPEVQQLANLQPLTARVIIELLRSLADHVVLDLAPPPSEATQAAVPACDHITVVSDGEPASASAAMRVQNYVRSISCPEGHPQFRVVDKSMRPPVRLSSEMTKDPEESYRNSLIQMAGSLGGL